MRLKDRVAIITGGGTGIGEAIATVFASEGAIVVLASRSLGHLQEVANKIIKTGGKVKAIQTDIADEKQVRRMGAQTVSDFGKIDILVNNAAATEAPPVDVSEMTLEFWNKCLSITLTGTMLCTREILKNMIPRRSGSIINISSIAGVKGSPGRTPYVCGKWGVNGLTETVAIEVGKYNIRVNSLSPAATDTGTFSGIIDKLAKPLNISHDEMMTKVLHHYSLRRIVKPGEIGTAALFLASDDSSAITGQNLIVSCGFHMLDPDEVM
jgi:NAD(P)-dependent dehydrogenase (short-subunit alcohol dehydrogenase family)